MPRDFFFRWAEYDIQGAFSKLYVAETGASAAPAAPSPQIVNQTAYWWAKRVTDEFYIAGQIWKNNLPAIKAAGFKSIVNFRALTTDVKGAPSQEEVTLLNVDHFGTYKNGESFRQKPANLEPKRIFPAAANAYIDIEGRTGSSVNYEVMERRRVLSTSYSCTAEKSQFRSVMALIVPL